VQIFETDSNIITTSSNNTPIRDYPPYTNTTLPKFDKKKYNTIKKRILSYDVKLSLLGVLKLVLSALLLPLAYQN